MSFEIKDAVPTMLVGGALGAVAAIFMDRPAKKAVTFGLVGAGIGAFAYGVFGVNLGKRGGAAVGANMVERSRAIVIPQRSIPAYQRGLAYRGAGDFQTGQSMVERTIPAYQRGIPAYQRGMRSGGFRARGDFAVGDWDDVDVVYEPAYYMQPSCPDGYVLDDWGNCIPVYQPPVVFSIEREVLYLYPELIIQYPELRLHPERIFIFRPELRERYAGVRSATEMRSRYQTFHHQPPPARPKEAPPVHAATSTPRGGSGGGGGGKKHGGGGGGAHAPATPPPAQPTPPPPPHAMPHAAMPTPPAPAAPVGPPTKPSQPAHAATGWYTPGWQYHFPPIPYEYNWYGPMENWWTT